MLVEERNPDWRAHDWILLSHESEHGRWYPPGPHEHSQGDVYGLTDRLAAIEARLTALNGGTA
ncbi:hypothetical protein ACYSMR_17965 (plasmid) [Kocuria sp. U4B]